MSLHHKFFTKIYTQVAFADTTSNAQQTNKLLKKHLCESSRKPARQRAGTMMILAVCGGILLAGCDKKDNRVDETTNADAKLNEPVESVVVPCDDQVALSQLSNAVRSSIETQATEILSTYAARADVSLDMNKARTAVGSILIDLADPTPVPSDDASSGMTTCQASLSLTLPNQDVIRAKSVYDSVEGESLVDKLAQINVTLNNNMLVNDAFTYVVGMQGSQAVAKVAGQPEMTRIVADMLAKSQFKMAMDANRPVVNNNPPASTTTPNRTQPQPRQETERPRPAPQTEPEISSQIEPKPAPSTPKKPISANDQPVPDPIEPPTEFKIPDDDIDIEIVDQEGTY